MKMIYLATRNSDQTEGRGRTEVFAAFTRLEDAILAVKGQGVMGQGDGEVYAIFDKPRVFESYDAWVEAKKPTPGWSISDASVVYGYHRDWQGNWKHGLVESAPLDDPDYLKYLELKQKFGVK